MDGIYEVSIWKEEDYDKLIIFDADRYARYAYAIYGFPNHNEKLANADVENITQQYLELHKRERHHEAYPSCNFQKRVRWAIMEYGDRWVYTMVCELKVDLYRVLEETDDDMSFDDWCTAELYKRSMKESAKRRGEKSLIS